MGSFQYCLGFRKQAFLGVLLRGLVTLPYLRATDSMYHVAASVDRA